MILGFKIQCLYEKLCVCVCVSSQEVSLSQLPAEWWWFTISLKWVNYRWDRWVSITMKMDRVPLRQIMCWWGCFYLHKSAYDSYKNFICFCAVTQWVSWSKMMTQSMCPSLGPRATWRKSRQSIFAQYLPWQWAHKSLSATNTLLTGRTSWDFRKLVTCCLFI